MANGETLKLDEVIHLRGHQFRVQGREGNYYLWGMRKDGAFSRAHNDQVFIDAGCVGDKYKIVQDITGERPEGGPWPEVRTLEQLTLVVETLRGTAS